MKTTQYSLRIGFTLLALVSTAACQNQPMDVTKATYQKESRAAVRKFATTIGQALTSVTPRAATAVQASFTLGSGLTPSGLVGIGAGTTPGFFFYTGGEFQQQGIYQNLWLRSSARNEALDASSFFGQNNPQSYQEFVYYVVRLVMAFSTLSSNQNAISSSMYRNMDPETQQLWALIAGGTWRGLGSDQGFGNQLGSIGNFFQQGGWTPQDIGRD